MHIHSAPDARHRKLDDVEILRTIPAKNIIVATDGGQMQNSEWYNTIAEYIDFLYDAGIPEEDIIQMTCTPPKSNAGYYRMM